MTGRRQARRFLRADQLPLAEALGTHDQLHRLCLQESAADHRRHPHHRRHGGQPVPELSGPGRSADQGARSDRQRLFPRHVTGTHRNTGDAAARTKDPGNARSPAHHLDRVHRRHHHQRQAVRPLFRSCPLLANAAQQDGRRALVAAGWRERPDGQRRFRQRRHRDAGDHRRRLQHGRDAAGRAGHARTAQHDFRRAADRYPRLAARADLSRSIAGASGASWPVTGRRAANAAAPKRGPAGRPGHRRQGGGHAGTDRQLRQRRRHRESPDPAAEDRPGDRVVRHIHHPARLCRAAYHRRAVQQQASPGPRDFHGRGAQRGGLRQEPEGQGCAAQIRFPAWLQHRFRHLPAGGSHAPDLGSRTHAV